MLLALQEAFEFDCRSFAKDETSKKHQALQIYMQLEPGDYQINYVNNIIY